MEPAFDQGWAVMCRDTGTLDGNQLNVVDALRIYWTEGDAFVEVNRLRSDDPDPNHFYYYEATEIARR